jgi:large subunit ribosomal protein L13e
LLHTANIPKSAGIPRKLAPTIGIAVDPRRQNLSEESLKANVERLKEFQKRIILFPLRSGKHKKTDASAADVKSAKGKDAKVHATIAAGLPIVNKPIITEAKLSDVKATEDAYRTLRHARADARNIGQRKKRAQEKADKEAEAKK